ncbi:MAG: phosphate/phosphite/phosphonate ABC transporter substrate-binding protein [Desulfovibrionaceae bacterium]|nr:phosphate/phosphite/phosphonate ABC transporter substrate-binding protein [Desulfovibrionaceae bacterium]
MRIMKPRFVFLLTVSLTLAAFLCLLAAWGCTDGEESVTVDLSRREPLAAPRQSEAITYAYLPQYSHTISFQRHRKMLEYLRKETGLRIRQIFPDTFDEHIKMVARGEIDISYSNPLVYLRLADAGAQAFARIIEPNGEPKFRGQIIVRQDNPAIKTVADCRGKRWIAVDPGSAGGYLFALGYFYEHGINSEDFETVDFAPGPGGKQEKVALAVYAGAYDVGSIRKGTLDVVADKINLADIRVLAETRPYPGWVYAARKGLDPAVVKAVARAMLKLDHAKPADAAILDAAGMRAIISTEDAEYAPVRALAHTLGLWR